MVAFWYKELLSAGVGFLFPVLGAEEDTYICICIVYIYDVCVLCNILIYM